MVRVSLGRGKDGMGGVITMLFYLAPFFRPTIVNEWAPLAPLKSIFSIWLLVACVAIAIRFVMRNGRIGLFLSGLVLTLSMMFASTLIHGGLYYDALVNSAMLLGTALFVLSLNKNEVKAFFLALVWLLFVLMAIELIFRILMPQGIYLDNGTSRWILQNGSLQSRWCFILVFASAVLDLLNYGRNSRLFYLSAFLSIALSIQLASATSTVALILELLFLVFVGNAWMEQVITCRRVSIVMFVLLLAIVLLRIADYLPYNEIAALLGKDLTYMRGATFTGRTYIWDAVIEAISQSPLLGYGYQQLVASGIYQFYSQTDFDSAHNLFLQIVYQGGLFALAAFFISYYSTCRKIDHANNGYFRLLYAGTLASFLLVSIFENTLTSALILVLAIPNSNALMEALDVRIYPEKELCNVWQ